MLKSMLRFVNARRTVAALATVAAIGGVLAGLPAQQADAGHNQMTTIIYYNNASHSNVVGVKTISCWNGTKTSGQVTPYSTTFYDPCFA